MKGRSVAYLPPSLIEVPRGALICVSTVRWATKTFDTFAKMGIVGPKPWPLVGTVRELLDQGIYKHDKQLHDKYGKIAGIYQGRQPVLMVADVEILKQILVKDFTSFKNRYSIETSEYGMSKMLGNLKDDHWKHVRNHLTPTFSGAKLRRMVDQMNRCGSVFVENLQTAVKAGDAFEAKSHAGCFGMDMIAATAFSLDVNSHLDENNKFVLMAKKAFDFEKLSFAFLVMILAPSLSPYLEKIGITVFPRDATEFFMSIIQKNIEYREKNPDKIPSDFLKLMLSAHIDEKEEKSLKEGSNTATAWSKSGLSREEVLGNALIFFLAGYETSAVTLSMTMYHLAIHQECQEKAYSEIMEVLSEDQDPTYDDMKKMKYLEMCVEETMRIFPPAGRTDRVADEDIQINGLFIPKGMDVGIPIYVLHTDPEVWANPEQFDPERFTPEAKEQRSPFQYMPFGAGPRNCIAQRFALLGIKIALVHLLRSLKLVTCEKTQIPLELKKMKIEGVNGTWLKAEPRQ